MSAAEDNGAPFGTAPEYRGPSLHQLLAPLREVLGADATEIVERTISDELRSRIHHVTRDAEACARTRPEYREAVGWGELVEQLLDFLADSPLGYEPAERAVL